MEITPEEFNDIFQETIDTLLVAMAEEAEVKPEKFYSMTCLLENLSFFSPVIYSALQNSKKP